jgi:hypothetical protein
MQSRVLSRASLKEECTDAYGLLRALLTDRGTDGCGVASEATEQASLRCQGINQPGSTPRIGTDAVQRFLAALAGRR